MVNRWFIEEYPKFRVDLWVMINYNDIFIIFRLLC